MPLHQLLFTFPLSHYNELTRNQSINTGVATQLMNYYIAGIFSLEKMFAFFTPALMGNFFI